MPRHSPLPPLNKTADYLDERGAYILAQRINAVRAGAGLQQAQGIAFVRAEYMAHAPSDKDRTVFVVRSRPLEGL